ncbi:MAG: amino acid adenylation domain-containing protein [Acidobacteriota bacterium]
MSAATHALVERIRSLPPAQRRALVERIRSQGVADLYPASYAQEQLWFLDRLRPGDSFYNIPVALELAGDLEPQRLSAAVTQVVRRHEALRTTFLEIDGEPFQRVSAASPEGQRQPLPVVDLRALAPELRDREARELARRESDRPFDLARGPLLRCSLLWLSTAPAAPALPAAPAAPALPAGPAARWGLLLTVHHIVSDGWSMGVLVQELGALYQDLPLPPLPRQYADFALWQRQRLEAGELERQLDWWRQQLAELPPMVLRGDRPVPALSSGRGHRVSLPLDPQVSEALGAVARRAGVSEFMVLLAAFGALLGRWSGAPSLAIGTAAAQRQRAELESLVGYFVNSLTLRFDLRGAGGDGLSFQQLVAHAREVAVAAFDHQEVPFDQVVKAVAPQRRAERNPLFQAMLTVQNLALRSPRLGDAVARPLGGVRESRKFDLHADWWPGEPGSESPSWTLSLQADADLFDRSTVERLARAYGRLLESALEQPETPLHRLPLLSAAERQMVAVEWAGGEAVVPCETGEAVQTIPLRFRHHAARNPSAPALTCGDETITYGELHQRSGHLARRLEQALAPLGVGRDQEATVGIAMERSPTAVVAMLAALEAGCAYVPLDPGYPRERLKAMVENAAPAVVVSAAAEAPPAVAQALASGLGELAPGEAPPPIVAVDGGGEAPEASLEDDLSLRRAPAGPDALAYILYTSGSTGRPKGVAVPQRAVLRLVEAQRGREGFLGGALEDQQRVFLLASPLAFDASTLELWGPLLHGAQLEVMAPGRFTPGELLATARRAGVTTLWVTAALFQRLVEEHLEELATLPALRELLTGGDVVSPAPVAELLRRAPHLRVVNGYGPTENTTFTCCRRLRPSDLERPSLPVGEPIPGTSAWVLDGHQRVLPPGVVGQLWTGGEGLARGYHRAPGATALAFRPHPRPTAPGERLYRTGDEARWSADGTVEFFGRRDRQIKLRGHRIELAEVEAAIGSLPSVSEVAVVLLSDPDPRLVAYVVGASEGSAESAPALDRQPLDLQALRRELAQRLPAPMMPALFIVLEALPLTAHGKVDRRNLPAPSLPASAQPSSPGRELDAAKGADGGVQARVAALWRELLRIPEVPVDEDFFAIGGHSLMVTQLLSRLQEAFAVEIPLRTLFDHPTVAGQARWLSRRLAAQGAEADSGQSSDEAAGPERGPSATPRLAVPIPRVSRQQPAPLSYAQERLWFLQQLQPTSTAYNEPMALEVKGELEVHALEQAFSRVVERHETLRTRFPRRDGLPVQEVVAAEAVHLPVVDLGGLPADLAAAEVQRLASAQTSAPFDLSRDALLRLAVVRIAPRHHRLTATLHHLVVDGWSLGILRQELSAAYASVIAGDSGTAEQTVALAPLPVQYVDFAAWQRQVLDEPEMERLLAYWRQRLEGSERLEIPTDRPRPALETYRGERFTHTLEGADVEALRHLAREHGTTLFVFLLAAFAEVLGRWSGRRDLLLGTLLAGRRRPEVEGLVGFFINTLALRLQRPEAGAPVAELLRGLRETVLEDFDRQDLPFERLVEALAPRRDLSRHPLFGVCFQLVESRGPGLSLPGLEVVGDAAAVHSAKFDLSLAWVDGGDRLTAILEINRELYDRSTGRRLLDQVLRWVRGAQGATEMAADQLPVLSPGQRHQLTVEWSRVPAAPAGGAGSQRLDTLVLEQARRSPGATALVWETGRWTYDELAARVELLATVLSRHGAEAESVVALYLERGPALLASVLATLRTGAAYVALDPAYPPQRLATMAQDAAPRVVVTSAELADRLPAEAAAATPLVVDELGAATAGLEAGTEVGAETPALLPAAPALPPAADPDAIAYLIYTSGSTGRPKGVAISHRAASALVRWAGKAFPEPWRRGVFAGTSLCFDLSIFELFLPLAHGGRVVMGRDALALDGHPAAQEVTMVNTVPSSLAELLRRGAVPPSVKAVCLAGEPLPKDLVASAEALDSVEAVFNLYGPSEDTTYSTWERVTAAVPHAPLVGRSVGGKRAYVLDRGGRPVPPGVSGELCLGGVGLARGYLRRPAATALSFRPDPFSRSPFSADSFSADSFSADSFSADSFSAGSTQTGARGERLYHTGDLASWTADGRLRFLGRRDHQVKVRGFRIEPGEIEERLRSHPRVEEAAVAALGEGVDRRLVAWVGGTSASSSAADAAPAADTSDELSAETLRAFVAEALPAYMVPAELLVLEALPRLPNGKVNRRELPSPEAARGAAKDARPPEGEMERRVAEAVEAVLGTAPGREENFFDLGAHSLRMVQVQERLEKELGREVPVLEMFRHPSVAALAAYLESSQQPPEVATAAFAAASDRGEALGRGRNRLAQRRRLGRQPGRPSGRPSGRHGGRPPRRPSGGPSGPTTGGSDSGGSTSGDSGSQGAEG